MLYCCTLTFSYKNCLEVQFSNIQGIAFLQKDQVKLVPMPRTHTRKLMGANEEEYAQTSNSRLRIRMSLRLSRQPYASPDDASYTMNLVRHLICSRYMH